MIAVSAAGRGSDNEIGLGVSVGSMYGVDFKLLHNNNLAIIMDLGVNLATSPFTEKYKDYKETGNKYGFFTFEFNPNVAYQGQITSNSTLQLDWYAGGGVSGGMFKAMTMNTDFGNIDVTSESNIMGKLGVNAIGGIDMRFQSVPLALSFDFRPGYGMATGKPTKSYDEKMTGHFFDWKLVLALRYVF